MVLSVVPNASEDLAGGEDACWNEDPGKLPVLSYGFCCSKGRRPQNEDRVMARPRLNGNSESNLYGVFDGHGGARAAEFAAEDMPRRVASRLQKGNLEVANGLALFQDVFKETDAAFCRQANAQQLRDGCTACVALVSGTDLFCASAGDSRAFLFRYGSALPISLAHKPGDKSEVSRIEAAGGQVVNVDGVMRVNGDLSTSRSLGDAHMKACIIPDPAVSHRKLTPGDEFLVIATDGLWDVCTSHRACDMMTSIGDAKRAARMLVDLALHQGTFDNVGVVVVDLRSLFTRDVPKGNPLVPLNMPQRIKSMADQMLESVDLFKLDQLHAGWLLKQSRGGVLLEKRWQKRWFVMQMVADSVVTEGSLHRKFIKKVFLLSYFDSEAESTRKAPRKPCVIDPAVGASREAHLDRTGRHCFSLWEASTSTPFILGAGSEEQANVWVGKLNHLFATHGFEKGSTAISAANLQRTLTSMEASDPNSMQASCGTKQMTLPNGMAFNGEFDGPVQVQRTMTGGLAAIGGGWQLSGTKLAQMDTNTVGFPGLGLMNPQQALFFGLPAGSAVVEPRGPLMGEARRDSMTALGAVPMRFSVIDESQLGTM
eukprot:CAMPEP_0180131982 /NCGR_PEP_ID=MMETSP0986-20121125/8730_1 /TAXON_ID=697907 /ORGANISM="non described non described, Strain CCMP2293" /LENGTH=597 /DNA_ID=CAMNT_0022071935 /DNA_START=216 /DNA_END=2009 /DNA_ORIENTATION=-